MKFKNLSLVLFLSATAIPACDIGTDTEVSVEESVLNGDSFVAVARDVADEDRAARTEFLSARTPGATSGDDFYLALHKSVLNQEWFLSAYMKQYLPDGVSGGAASSMGTRVVQFKVQNNRLYVFDSDNRKASSDVFEPEVIVESYPIISTSKRFGGMSGKNDYILIDPAAGLNRFGVVGDSFGSGNAGGSGPVRFEIELSFLQNFRQTEDGVTFEHIFSGYSDEFLADSTGGVEATAFRGSGTLGIALRKYSEGKNYQEVAMPGQSHFFASEPRLNSATGEAETVAAHWDIYPGMPPIQWHLPKELVAVDAEKPGYDLVDAVSKGIESWNDAFGFPVFEAVLASAGESFADDDKNFVIFDENPSLGYAFANWRTNPNTGEIRGASVYLSAAFIADGEYPVEEDGQDAVEAIVPHVTPPPATLTRLTWDAMRSEPLCAFSSARHETQAIAETPEISNKETVENYLTYVVAHEIGHTLGLRHNFKGSLGMTSVMDYSPVAQCAANPNPGQYDIEAIQYLYGLSEELPSGDFCTDGDYSFDPNCGVFDVGSDPLVDMSIPDYTFIEEYFLQGWIFQIFPNDSLDSLVERFMSSYGNSLLGFVRAGDSESALFAYQTAMANTAPQNITVQLPAEQAIVVDALAAWVIEKLYVTANDYISVVPADKLVQEAILSDISDILTNSDGNRFFNSRRKMVDVLKQMQSVEALLQLQSARDLIAAQPVPESATDAALQADLLARINTALSPYFDN